MTTTFCVLKKKQQQKLGLKRFSAEKQVPRSARVLVKQKNSWNELENLFFLLFIFGLDGILDSGWFPFVFRFLCSSECVCVYASFFLIHFAIARSLLLFFFCWWLWRRRWHRRWCRLHGVNVSWHNDCQLFFNDNSYLMFVDLSSTLSLRHLCAAHTYYTNCVYFIRCRVLFFALFISAHRYRNQISFWFISFRSIFFSLAILLLFHAQSFTHLLSFSSEWVHEIEFVYYRIAYYSWRCRTLWFRNLFPGAMIFDRALTGFGRPFWALLLLSFFVRW